MIDVDAALAALEADRAKLDAAIAALRALKNGAPSVAAPSAAPPVRRRAPSAPQEHYGKVTPEQWDQARTWWDAGETAVEIGKRLGITDVSVHWHAQQHSWPKRRRGVQPVGPTAVAVPAGPPATTLNPKRRCPHCAGMTATDPCSWCKKGLAA